MKSNHGCYLSSTWVKKLRNFQIDQGVLGLGRGSRDYYLNSTMFSKHLEAYKLYQREIIKLLMADANITYNGTQLDNDLNEIIELEKKLAIVNFCVFRLNFCNEQQISTVVNGISQKYISL